MLCHSTSSKTHQLTLTVSPVTKSIVEKISKRCCLIDECVVCLTDQEKQFKDFRSNDIGTYLATLKIGRNNVVIGDILNEKFLKSHPHLPEKFAFIA